MKKLPNRLLFVDDEPNIRATLPIILQRYGFVVTVAATVPEALAYVAKQQFDLLLCDLNINGEANGLEVVRAMRLLNPSCVTIVLTGFPSPDTVRAGLHLGIDDYIHKPTDANTLVAILAEKLISHQPRPQNVTVESPEPINRAEMKSETALWQPDRLKP